MQNSNHQLDDVLPFPSTRDGTFSKYGGPIATRAGEDAGCRVCYRDAGGGWKQIHLGSREKPRRSMSFSIGK